MQLKENFAKAGQIDSISFQDRQAGRQNFERVSGKLSPNLAGALPGLLADSPDPDSSLLLFDHHQHALLQVRRHVELT